MNSLKCLNAALSALIGALWVLSPPAAQAQPNLTGQWAKLPNLPAPTVHNQLLPNGKVMIWGRNAIADLWLWDPATQSATVAPGPGYDLFCAGHAYLADERMLVPGGHIADFVGLSKAAIYNTLTNTWSAVPDMNAGRWYPTTTTLPNGDALVVSGDIDTVVGNNKLPQVYQTATNTWRNLTNAQLDQGLYPMMFVAPNGKVFDAAPTHVTRYLDTSGTGSWTFVGYRNFGWKDYGTAVMYGNGKILVAGGSDPPTATAEVIDLNAATPSWRAIAPMSIARRHLNSTLLPDGTVLVTGGTWGPGHNNAATPVFSAELWNPATEGWTTMASASIPRLYHSAAVLLPDGRVITTGGDGYSDIEVFSPPYLFKGARPTMTGAPATVGYGQNFSVQSPDAASISKVTLIRLAAVTHAFDQNQRINTLQFSRSGSNIDITAPANSILAPPGIYMLFILNGTGVPSVASMIKLGGSSPPPSAPAISSLVPATANAGGPAFTLTVNGSNFVSGSTVRWNGASRPTTFVSSTRLTAAIAAADIASAGTAQVSVANPGGATSGASAFTVSASGSCNYPAWVQGQQYAAGAIVNYNGSLYIAKFDNPGYNPTISTYFWAPYTCGSTPPPSAPAISSLVPASATAGGPAFTLTVNGSNFVSGAVVRWNGASRTTGFSSSTQLTAAITAADIASAGSAQVSVANPGGATSGASTFTVSAPGGCSFPAWVQYQQYPAGAIVSYNGSLYIAKFANPGYIPTVSTYYWAPYTCA